MQDIEWRLFDSTSDLKQTIRDRPHWDQSALTFVTFRLADSMPREVVQKWQREQAEWLRTKGLADLSIEESATRGLLPEPLRRQFLKFRNEGWHRSLDDCHGSCLLRDQRFARIVADTLLYFDNQRYDIERFVVMPNHVHLLVQMRYGVELQKQCSSWMRFSATKLNSILNRRGDFWQAEPFDHIVRNERQFEYLQKYISDNPTRAKLREGEFLLWVRK